MIFDTSLTSVLVHLDVLKGWVADTALALVLGLEHRLDDLKWQVGGAPQSLASQHFHLQAGVIPVACGVQRLRLHSTRPSFLCGSQPALILPNHHHDRANPRHPARCLLVGVSTSSPVKVHLAGLCVLWQLGSSSTADAPFDAFLCTWPTVDLTPRKQM